MISKIISLALTLVCLASTPVFAAEKWPMGWRGGITDPNYADHDFNVWEMQSIIGLKNNEDVSTLRLFTITSRISKFTHTVIAESCGRIRLPASRSSKILPFRPTAHRCMVSEDTESGLSLSAMVARREFTNILNNYDVDFGSPVIDWEENKLVLESDQGEVLATFMLEVAE